MYVELRDLELLDTLAEVGTLTAAADRLYVSQPALSQRLARLEDRLGGPLFQREGRKLLVTPAGVRMLSSARTVLAELRSAERDIREIRAGRDQRVRFTAQCSTTYQWLPPVISALQREHPGTEVRIEQVAGDEPLAALLDDRVDVALVTKPDRLMERLHVVPLFRDQMVAVVALNHPWTRRSHVTARDFTDVHLVLYDIYDQSRSPAQPLPLPASSRPGRVSTVPLVTDLVIEMVAAGEGISVLPQWVAAPYTEGPNARVAAVRIGAHGNWRTWHLATRVGDHAPAVVDFVELVAARFRAGTSGVQDAPSMLPALVGLGSSS
ncbi:LysR family transcriptional regulator [Nocardioides astragali]|uniref:LysR family transcriptional regulator n=1 Tax=Nocardioides astragali TaxID=1776736 RepID=A0ABW2N8E9_9ACTN|nr:LysR family transcriptional regulator [Nocardioides astragali]